MRRFLNWDRLAGMCDDNDEILLVVRSIAGPCTGTKPFIVGNPPVLSFDPAGPGGKPEIELLGMTEDELVAHCELAFNPLRRWATSVLVGKFDLDGGLSVGGLQLRPVLDLRRADLSSFAPSGLPIAGPSDSNALYMDVEYDASANPYLNFERRRRAILNASNFLALVLTPRVRPPHDGFRTTAEWTLVWDADAGEVKNAELVRGLSTPTGEDSSTPPSLGTDVPIPIVPHAHLIRGPLDLGRGLHVADTFEQLWARASTSPPDRKISRALAWFSGGLRATDPALKITSYVTAIEAAMPEIDPDICPECRQDRYRLTKRVQEFLERYSDGVAGEDLRRSMYVLRSKLVHGSHRQDVDRFLFSTHKGIYDDVDAVELVVGASLLNWLLG